jgi:hypothetical protein
MVDEKAEEDCRVKTGTKHLAEVLCVLLTCTAGAWAQIHPSVPAVNLGDTSFLDAVGGPGLVVEEICDGNPPASEKQAQSLMNSPDLRGSSISFSRGSPAIIRLVTRFRNLETPCIMSSIVRSNGRRPAPLAGRSPHERWHS